MQNIKTSRKTEHLQKRDDERGKCIFHEVCFIGVLSARNQELPDPLRLRKSRFERQKSMESVRLLAFGWPNGKSMTIRVAAECTNTHRGPADRTNTDRTVLAETPEDGAGIDPGVD